MLLCVVSEPTSGNKKGSKIDVAWAQANKLSTTTNPHIVSKASPTPQLGRVCYVDVVVT